MFQKVRENARRASCQSNEKQLGLAFIQYTQDADEKYPGGVGAAVSGRLGVGWAGELYPFVKSTGLYKCPDDSTAVVPAAGAVPVQNPVSYAFNGHIGGLALAQLDGPASTVNLSEINNSVTDLSNTGETGAVLASYIDLGDNLLATKPDGTGQQCCGGPAVKYTTGVISDFPGGRAGGQDNPGGRHTDGANYLLTDGHVKWLRGAQVTSANAPFDMLVNCKTVACFAPN